MRCARLSDAELVRAIMADMDGYMQKHPMCPRPLAAYELLTRKQGGKPADIVRDVNRLNTSTYSTNIVGKWRRGERPVPRDVEAYLRGEILGCVLGPVGKDLVVLLGEQ